MKNKLLRVYAITILLLLFASSTFANDQTNQGPKVIVGTYVSAQGGKIKIKGRDGNIYLLEKESIDSSVIVRDGFDRVNVMTSDGIKELKEGSTVVINVKGIVLIEVKETLIK